MSDGSISKKKKSDALKRHKEKGKEEEEEEEEEGKSPRYPLDRRLGGPQSRSGRGNEEENFLIPLGIEPRSNSEQAPGAAFRTTVIKLFQHKLS
jgi:hypothetical protein